MNDFFSTRAPVACIFLTLRLSDRSSDLLIRAMPDLRRAMREVKTRHPFTINAITVLPATLHTLWSLPAGEQNAAKRIALLKARFSRAVPTPRNRTLAQIKRGDKGIWQRHTWEHRIMDAADYARHRDLIYLSPVHAGLCQHPQDWVHTSLHRDLRRQQNASAPVPQAPVRHRPQGENRHVTDPGVMTALG